MMTSFLIKERTKKDYFEIISSEPIGTQKNKRFVISNFEKFVSYKYNEKTFDDILKELSVLLSTLKDSSLKLKSKIDKALEHFD